MHAPQDSAVRQVGEDDVALAGVGCRRAAAVEQHE